MVNVDLEGMNCILGDGGSRAYTSYGSSLIMLRRNGSWQDTAG